MSTETRRSARTPVWSRGRRDIKIGAGGLPFTGDLAEIQLYDGSLNSMEVASLTQSLSDRYFNRQPVARDDAYLATAGQQLEVSALQGVLANDGNPDQAFVASVVSDVSQGELELRADGSFTYRPRLGFAGHDQFIYRVSDGVVTSSPAAVDLAVQRLPVIISEVMASNHQTLVDEDRDSSDWVELFNYGSQTVNLDGWYLTDQPNHPTQWRFPAVSIEPGEFLTVFASGKDRRDETAPWHTNFRLDAGGEFLALVEPDGRTWASVLTQRFPVQVRDVAYGLPNAGAAKLNFADVAYAYLATPTPGAANSDRSELLGPIISQVAHQPELLSVSDDLVITAQLFEVNDPIAQVTLHYRLMYAAEHTVPMVDDGSQGDQVAGDGVYTALLRTSDLQQAWQETGAGQESLAGKMLRYAISSQDTAGRTLRAPQLASSNGLGDEPEYFGTVFQNPEITSDLPVLHWFVPHPNWHKTTGGNNTRWSPASVYFDGEFYDNLRVRVRGITTIDWNKPKFKFEFNPGYPFRYADDMPRVDEFNLQSHYLEKGATSYMGENLAFAFLQQIGVPAPNTFHLHVQQNGDFYSLASFVEQIDQTFLQRNGLDEFNPMYKANSPSARSTLAPNPSRADYQKVTREWEPYDDLRQLTDGINNRILEVDRSAYLFDYVNLAEVINNMAGNTILTNHDRLTKNYYMYRDASGSGEWSRFPWDMDQAFAKRTDSNFSSVLYGDSEHPQATGQPVYQNHLLDAILDTPFTRQMYLRRLRTLLDEYLVGGYFEAWIDETARQIAADADRDHARWHAGLLADGIARLQENLRFRRMQLLADPLVPPSNQVFASTTLLDPQAAVRVLVPTRDDEAAGWFTAGGEFDDSTDAGWRVGVSGVGYDRGTGYQPFLGSLFADEARQVPLHLLDDLDPDGDGDNLTTTVYARFHFSVDDPLVFQQLLLKIRYDDAFVAFLNGVEVARANYVGTPRWNAVARQGNHEASEEFESFDLSFVLDAGGADLAAGENVLAVFVINAQSNSPDLLLQPQLIGLTETPPQFEIAFGEVATGSAGGHSDEEFLELQSHSTVAVDLSGWRLEGAIQFAFPPGTVLPAGGSLYLSPDVRAFRARATRPSGGQGLFVQGPYTGRLAHANQSIQLIDHWQQLVAQRAIANDPTPLQQFLRVSELHYNPPGDNDATEFIEFVNLSQGPDAVTLDLSGVRIVDGPRDPFVFPLGTQLAPAGHILVVKDAVRFREAYAEVASAQIAGQYVGSLANDGEAVQVNDAEGRLLIQFTYADQSPWPVDADGLGYSLEVVAFQGDYSQPDTWRASQHLGGTPGRPRSAPPRGDFNGDVLVDAADVDLLCRQIRRASHPPLYDLTGDARVDRADLEELIEQILQTRFGDANLDGRFDSSDLVAVFQPGEYEDALANNSGWSDGDWNGDGEFSSSDLVLAFQAGGFESPAARGSVPDSGTGKEQGVGSLFPQPPAGRWLLRTRDSRPLFPGSSSST